MFGFGLGLTVMAYAQPPQAQQQRELTCDEQLTEEKFQHGRVMQQYAVERARHGGTQNQLQSVNAKLTEYTKKEQKADEKKDPPAAPAAAK